MPTANETFASRKPGGNASLADELARQQAQLAAMTTAERVDKFGFSSFEVGEYMMAYDALGQARMRIGTQSDGTLGVLYANGDPPPKVSRPAVAARQLAIGVYWDGTFADGKARPGDVVRVDIHRSTTAHFTVDATTAVGSLTAEGIELLPADNVTHYVKLVAVTSSDVIGPPSDEVAVLPLAANQIAARAIGADQLAVTIALASEIIVGRPTAGRLHLDGREGAQQGLRMYSPGGEETVTFDSMTGDATLRGTLRTADSGTRIVIPRAVDDFSFIAFFPSSGLEYAGIMAATAVRGAIDMFSGRDAVGRHSALSMFSDGVAMVMRNANGAGVNGINLYSDGASNILGPPGSGMQIDSNGARIVARRGVIALTLSGWDNNPNVTNAVIVKPGNWADVFLDSTAGVAWHFQHTPRTIICRHADANSALPVGASEFVVYTSDRDTKEEIAVVPFNALAAVRAAPSYEWQHITAEPDEQGRKPRHIGPMLDDLPSALAVDLGEAGRGLGLHNMAGVLWHAVSQLADRVENLESVA